MFVLDLKRRDTSVECVRVLIWLHIVELLIRVKKQFLTEMTSFHFQDGPVVWLSVTPYLKISARAAVFLQSSHQFCTVLAAAIS